MKNAYTKKHKDATKFHRCDFMEHKADYWMWKFFEVAINKVILSWSDLVKEELLKVLIGIIKSSCYLEDIALLRTSLW